LGFITRNDGRRWRHHLFEPTPLCICTQEERTTGNPTIGVEEGVGEVSRECMSEEEDKFYDTSQGILSVSIYLIVSSNSRRKSTRLRIENHDTT
jgi:hypothetical protein